MTHLIATAHTLGITLLDRARNRLHDALDGDEGLSIIELCIIVAVTTGLAITVMAKIKSTAEGFEGLIPEPGNG